MEVMIERMKTTMQKYEIIDLKLKGWSNSKIHNEFGVSRDTVRRYWEEYKANLSLLLNKDPDLDTRHIIENIVSDPHYDTSNRKARKYNLEIDTLLDKILIDEEIKNEKLGNHKQKLTQVQIFEMIKAEGYDIGLTTIQKKINEKRNIHSEAFIKQVYDYGQRFEYDFGEVKLIINGKCTKGFLAVLTSPASGFRWAYLYHNTKMEVFIDSQVKFFEMVGGTYKEGVYDNMKNVVSKFIGRNEKQLNEQLIKLAIYYGFTINVTNCFSGNEKGNVESAVKWIRNKVFALNYEFESFLQADEYLQNELIKINSTSLIEEEKKHLGVYRPKYESAIISTNNVDKYSFIQVDTNFYSVPDYLVSKTVLTKVYPNNIDVYYKGDKVASHIRCLDKKKTCIDIKHYLNTFLRKPGALKNSQALRSVPKLKDIFDNYYKNNPKFFIDILKTHQDLSIDEIVDLLRPTFNKHNETNDWIEDETIKQLKSITNLFIGGKHDDIIH